MYLLVPVLLPKKCDVVTVIFLLFLPIPERVQLITSLSRDCLGVLAPLLLPPAMASLAFGTRELQILVACPHTAAQRHAQCALMCTRVQLRASPCTKIKISKYAAQTAQTPAAAITIPVSGNLGAWVLSTVRTNPPT
jgi:hypothetical protein